MKENIILAYLKREPAEFNIDEFLLLIGREELLTQEDEQQFIAQAQQGDTASMHRLLSAHMRFVVSLANQYKGEGLTLQKLVQVGVQGLEQAIMEYKMESEKPLIKFAVPVMRDVIYRYIGEAVKQYDTAREMSLKAFAEPSVRVAMQGIINGGA